MGRRQEKQAKLLYRHMMRWSKAAQTVTMLAAAGVLGNEQQGCDADLKSEEVQSANAQIESLLDDLNIKDVTIAELTEELDLQMEVSSESLEEWRKKCDALQNELHSLKVIKSTPLRNMKYMLHSSSCLFFSLLSSLLFFSLSLLF
jgi:hypothetical protein